MQFQGRLQDLPTRVRQHIATVEPDVSPDDIISNEYWWPASTDLRAGDTIRVDAIDMSWTCELRVLGVDKTGRRVVVAVERPVLRFDAPNVPDGFAVKWNGAAYGWRIERDGHLVRQGFASRLEAVLWLRADRGLDALPAVAAPAVSAPVKQQLEIKFTPRNQTWRLVDVATGDVVEAGLPTEVDAQERMAELMA